MRRLMLFRHAKSSWDDPELTDFDRPLNKRGRKAVPLMGRHIAGKGLLPERILCSTSKRTRETLAGLLSYLRDETSIELLPQLYEASAATIREVVRTQGGEAETLMVIGHNPGLQTCASELIGSDTGRLADSVNAHFPTGALAVIDFEIADWAEAERGRLVSFCGPKDLGATADD